MRASLLLLAGGAALAGIGLYARPGEPARAGRGIVVVRGGAPAAPVARAASVTVPPPISDSPVAAEAEEFGDPGIWATPAEFAPPERAD